MCTLLSSHWREKTVDSSFGGCSHLCHVFSGELNERARRRRGEKTWQIVTSWVQAMFRSSCQVNLIDCVSIEMRFCVNWCTSWRLITDVESVSETEVLLHSHLFDCCIKHSCQRDVIPRGWMWTCSWFDDHWECNQISCYSNEEEKKKINCCSHQMHETMAIW